VSARAPRFAVYRDAEGQWRWRLQAANGRTLASGEAHARRHDAVRAARCVRAAAVAGNVTLEGA
jgi:uncharacterized protein YegP (UPF0339 family)